MSITSRTPQDFIELMVNANDEDEYAQAFVFFDELISEGELDTEVVSRIGPELLRRMHSDLGNEKLQERLRKILKDLDRRCGLVIHAIHDFVQEHPEDASVARFGYRLILNESFKDYHGYSPVVVDCMVRHEKDPIVQEYAMRVMKRALGDDDRMFVALGTAIFLQAFFQAMRSHPYNLRVQEAAFGILYYFNFDDVIDHEWPPATILQTLNSHLHCAELQEEAFDYLGCLLDGIYEGFCHCGGDHFEETWSTRRKEELFLAGRDVVEAVLRALQTHPTNEKVQGTALRVLERMTGESASLNRIIQGGGVDLIIRAMHIFGGKMACLGAIMILKPLFGCSTDARRRAIELGAIPMLLEVFQEDNFLKYDFWYTYGKEISWCAAVCATLNELFLENIDRAVSFQIANEGGIQLIVDAIGRYVETESINCFPHQFELKDVDILAHLAMFPADDGKLPLHYAAHRGNKSHKTGRMAVLEHLLKVCPEAATVRDGSGRLPLHVAIESRASLSVIEVLLRANPDTGEAVCRRSNDTMLNFPPVLMAAASDCDLECIFALLRYAPTAMKKQVVFTSRKRKSPPV